MKSNLGQHSFEEDQELVNALRGVDFDTESDEWRTLATALVEYGYSVIVGWLTAGVIFARARDRAIDGLSRIPEDMKLLPDEAHSLAVTLLLDAVESFRVRVLIPNRWKAEGGASLNTFFIGWCLFRLPDAHERWCRLEGPLPQIEGDRDADRRTALADAAARGLCAAQLAEVREAFGGPVWEMFQLQAAGFHYDEIANMLETTEGIVRTRLSRARALLKERYGHDATA